MKLKPLATLYVACFLLAGGSRTWADSGSSSYGGRWDVMTGQRTSVRLVSERVTINVFRKDCAVRAEYAFYNAGPACHVKMGFPEQGYNYSDGQTPQKRSLLTNLATSADGKLFTARRAPLTLEQQTEDFQEFYTYWTKTLSFGKGQTRHVTLSFREPLGISEEEDLTTGYAVYAFRDPTMDYPGCAQHCEVAVYLHEPGSWRVTSSAAPRRSLVTRYGATFFFTFNGRQPAEGGISFTRVPQGWLHRIRLSKEFSLPHITGRSNSVFHRTTQTLTVPGHAKSGDTPLQYIPPALWRDNRVWINLKSLRDALTEIEPSRVSFVNSMRNREVTVQTPSVDVTFYDGRNTIKVRDNKTQQTRMVTLPHASWTLTAVQGSQLYVPAAAVVALWGGKVVSDPSAHSFDLSFPTRPLLK